ncbi:MAG TPA: Sir2 family NAD-dependent protein deacetylase [Acidimicrobiales bacterium]
MSLIDRSALARARELVERSRRIVVLTGAGISTDSGIADFRGPQGIWTKDPAAEKLATIEHYLSSSEARQAAWQRRLTSTIDQAEPNPGHTALFELERSGRLDTLVTQNIDGLHQRAGHDPARIIEIHGTARDVVCLRCGHRQPAQPVHDRVRSGEHDPHCLELVGGAGEACGGILKSAVISFGQDLVVEDLRRAELAARDCDLLLTVGSTLGVYPAAGLVPIAARSGADIVIMNGGPTELDAYADVLVFGSLSDALSDLVQGLRPVG